VKPFKTEGDAWRFLAREFEKVRATRYSKFGLCGALARLVSNNRISGSLYRSMDRRLRHRLSPAREDVMAYGIHAYWWPLYEGTSNSKTGRAERALACAFLAVHADESGVNRDTSGETFDA
jgi:hypothetical protein